MLLIEAEDEGAKQFTERVRTRIGSNAYARRADGTGLFARAWAGVASWEPTFDSVEAYARAAEHSLASTYRGYEAARTVRAKANKADGDVGEQGKQGTGNREHEHGNSP